MKLRLAAYLSLSGVALAGCGSSNVSTPPAAVQQAPQVIVQTSASSPPAQAAPSSALIASSPPASASPASAVAAPSSAAVSVSAVASPGSTQGAPSLLTSPSPPGPAVLPVPETIRLGPLSYIRQTLNNCGPAAIAEVLRFWGVEQTQGQAQAALRPDNDPRGMWPYGVPGYVHGLGMDSIMGVGGSLGIVKALVANGFPVIAAQWVSAGDHTAHYREIEGFDDKRQVVISTDSYLGPNHEISYAEFNEIWARGNQRFMLVFPPAKRPLVNAVLASVNWSVASAYATDLDRQLHPPASAQASAPPPQFSRPGDRFLGLAWDHIQLGSLDAAKGEIDQAAKGGANPLFVQWLTEDLRAATPS